MKSVLEAIQKLHDSVIDKILNVKGGISTAQVSGTTLKVSGVAKSFTEMRNRYQEVQNHRKTYHRFKKDPTKLVFEKETFLKILNRAQRCFLFRPINDNGDFYLSSDRVVQRVPETIVLILSVLAGIVLWLFVLLCLLFFGTPKGFIDPAALFPLSLGLSVAFGLLMNVIINKRLRKKWKKKYENNPSTTCAFDMYGSVKVNANVSIPISNIDMLEELMELAFKMAGKIVWLWDYNHPLNKDKFSITCPDDVVFIEIKDSSVYYLIPAIETNDSIIFSLKHYPSLELNEKSSLLAIVSLLTEDEVS